MFRREEIALGHEQTCLHKFSSRCQVCQSGDFSLTVHRFFFIFLASFRTFYEKLGNLSLFFFQRSVLFLTKKHLAYQV